VSTGSAGASRARPPSTTLLAELRRHQSILRSATNESLAKLSLRLPPGARVLDAGGPTTTSWDAVGAGEPRSTIAANLDPRRHPQVVADLDGPWPLRAESFDAVVSFWVLEHVRRPHRFFAESYRCLRPGGLLLLTTVLTHPLHASPHDYFRFTDDGLRSLARDAGFESAETVALLAGPLQCLCSFASPWLLFPLVRYLALAAARGSDLLLRRLFPRAAEGWCVGYILVAAKGTSSRP
jgi:SAM-dependent methyltransferase